MIDFMLDTFKKNAQDDAIVWNDKAYNYQWLYDKVLEWDDYLEKNNFTPGTVVALEADFSPNAVGLFLSLVRKKTILVPLTSSVANKKDEFLQTAEVEKLIKVNKDDSFELVETGAKASHELLLKLQQRQHPGLILFSSGSTGKSKAALHDLTGILKKFEVPRHKMRSISFLLYDHIGGVNTMLYVLSNGGCLVTVPDRNASTVLGAIDKHRVELLPTSPTFLNLVLISESYRDYKLESLKVVTYGTEPMPESTLQSFHKLFPHIKLTQTYGLSELGILRSKSKSSDSLWVKIGGEGFQTRVVDNLLEIKAESAMMGYLNAISPFTEDGWFKTGDAVETDGDYFKILGRKSELINVGGEKVYPAEVESTILELPEVEEVTAFGEPHPLTGQVVAVELKTNSEDTNQLKKAIKRHCNQKLERFKIPVKFYFTENKQHSERFKKMRADISNQNHGQTS